ncbi:D-ribose ABC transporter substrate-binding protein [Brachyspira catarrhinii]|uniref:D-ribose ABC transporter substrate-binding protein n=1 Tax=Brachyspira catarrhinii TaxID=2528966 RepID=A0ABY2TSH7_9SPIR|nr:D-ribose ABC transporter substrate-binding protein [Brachyspira catarrhinii]TKZ35716.1 D-ribose ABC transporter substrate-binding protein [Brachyspira catarrhinii]
MKKIIIITLLSILILSCKSGESQGNRATVGLSVSTLNNPFFVSLSDGARQKAKELNINLSVVNASDDTAKQTSDIEDLISKNVQVIIVNPVDSDAVAPAVLDAINANIPVISVDRGVNGVEVTAAISSDNVAGARLAGEYLIELIGENSKVAELIGIPGATATIDRGKGFHQSADGRLNIVASQTANFNRAEGLTVMENILQANPDIKGVFAHNDEMALGALEAVESLGKDIVIIGFDATDDAIYAVQTGTMKATVAQQPELMGAIAIETALKIINGETVEKTIPVEITLIKE